MNANELVEYMKTHDYSEGDVKNLFDLVDDQQAKIEALKKDLAKYDELAIDDLKGRGVVFGKAQEK